MPGQLKIAHHTLADWDFEKGSQYRQLSATHYVSAPTSLRMGYAPGWWRNAVLCRIEGTLVLPQGEVRTWTRHNYGVIYPAIFRNQAALGTANWLNCYYVSVSAAYIILHRSVNGDEQNRDATSTYWQQNTWVHYRVFWYNGKTPGEVPALCVDVYREVDGEWLKIGSTMYDTSNSWADSEINRCGILFHLVGGHLHYHDDTEIWGPV